MKAIFNNNGLSGRIATLTVVAILMMAATALAHHSFTAEFDQNKPVQLKGKVTEMKWSNPHAWIYIDVTTNGKTVNWACETGGANSLIRRGWRKEDLKYGTVLSMNGWQARNGTPTANVRSITLPDGKTLFAGTSNTAADDK
jgi:hypothetical protein